MIPLQPKHLALVPVYIYQGLKLKKTALRLPEAQGERSGHIQLIDNNIETKEKKKAILNLMLVGDSSAAGVGVSSQHQALAGQLIEQLQLLPKIQQDFSELNWSLHATSGHTSFDTLRRLYVIAKPQTPVDVMIVMLGVNDTTTNVSPAKWQAQLCEIINLSKRKFGAKYILFPCLPPMQNMPAIPRPLNQLMGQKTQVMNDKLLEVCEQYDDVLAVPIDFRETGLSATQLFAEDGFHPSAVTYSFWAAHLAKTISELV